VPEGFAVVSWPDLTTGWIAHARAVGMRRSSLETPAQPWFDWFARIGRLAVTDVDLDGPVAAADLLGFVIEPATRLGVELVIQGSQAIEDLDDAAFLEPYFGYPYSLERLRWRLRGAAPILQAPPSMSAAHFHPDPQQAVAVEAGEGVTQVISPAGSGKTAVLVERVRELRRRGVPADAIACLTFNRAAKDELTARLREAGVGDVAAFTFHGLAHRILVGAGALSGDTAIGAPNLAQWRRLASIAKEEATDGVWIEPADAAEALSEIKLKLLLTPERYADTALTGDDVKTRTMVSLYKGYEKAQRERGAVDFDDLVLRAVLMLRSNREVREQWQTRYQQLLIDEYQDIEPAQELIVRIVAAPHDQLFCVGDEDQTLYAFRRAGVERMVCLDALYPGLQRAPLSTNYRCPARVVAASAALIAVNQVRFPKQIDPDPDRTDLGWVNLLPYIRPAEDAAEIAAQLKGEQPSEIVVLARTTNALRPLALACAERGVAISGSDKLFEPSSASLALQRHLRLALYPAEATAEQVARVCQTPNRGLARGADQTIAASLRQGQAFGAAFQGIPPPRWGRGPLNAPGELFEALAGCTDAASAVSLLRAPGGLDEWFEQSDNFGGPDRFEAEVLADAEFDADGESSAEFLAGLEDQAEALRAVRHDEGIELLTIHAAKGRQWPHVILLACDEGILPHTRAGRTTPSREAQGEGVEAERRLAYVALTRAGQRLDLHYSRNRPSRFLKEAGLLPTSTRPRPVPSGFRVSRRSLWGRWAAALLPRD
jgi:superfamily I DNA/RNA helicase